MRKRNPLPNLTAKDYQATYLRLSVVCASMTAILVAAGLVWEFFATEITYSTAPQMTSFLLLIFNAVLLEKETVKRFGFWRLTTFYFIAGQVLFLLPVLLFSNILGIPTTSNHVFLTSLFGALAAILAVVLSGTQHRILTKSLGKASTNKSEDED